MITTSPTQAPAAARRRTVPIWLAILAASLPMFMASLDNLVMTNALPVIHEEMGATVEELQWFVNAYTLSFATFILMAVALGEHAQRDAEDLLASRVAGHPPWLSTVHA
jgi:MFS family permease